MEMIPLKLIGKCMRPLLKDGSCVVVVKTKDIKLGDIVLFEVEGRNFLHRIVKVLDDGYIVSDDCGITNKIFVSKEQVLGKYPTIFNGYFGFLYHIVIKGIFILLRNIKRIIQKIF